MTNDFPHDDEPDFEQTHAEAPPDFYAEDEAAIVPPPSQVTIIKSMPVPRARRQLKEEADALKQAMVDVEMKASDYYGDSQLSERAIEALVCATLDLQLPLDTDDPRIPSYRDQAAQGKFTTYTPLAMDELENSLATIEAAIAALKAISMLDQPIPAQWGNLAALPMARKLNGLGHLLLRGRIAGTTI